MYSPNLGLEFTVPGRERDQGRFSGTKGRSREVAREHGRAKREHRGSKRGKGGAATEYYGTG